MKGKPLTDQEKEAIGQLRAQGLTIREISERFSLSKDAVHRACRDVEVPLRTKRRNEHEEFQAFPGKLRLRPSRNYRGSPVVYANSPYQAQEEEEEEGESEVIRQQEYERLRIQTKALEAANAELRARIEREAREAAIAEERARREREEKVSNARQQFFKKLSEALKAGKIDYHQFVLLRMDRHTMGEIESGEKVLEFLAGNPSTGVLEKRVV